MSGIWTEEEVKVRAAPGKENWQWVESGEGLTYSRKEVQIGFGFIALGLA